MSKRIGTDMRAALTLLLVLGLATTAPAQLITGGPVSPLVNPVTSAQGGLGGDFAASTGILYDAAGTFSVVAGTLGLLQGGAPPACTTSPSLGTASATSLSLGAASPTTITNVRVYTPSLTPSQLSAAIGVSEQTFTVSGLTTADKVYVNGPAPTALCPPITYRVSATNTLAIGFVDLTVALCTPAAGTYTVVAIRS